MCQIYDVNKTYMPIEKLRVEEKKEEKSFLISLFFLF